ncbi:MAG: hypothetical protein BJG00_002585 [Limnothrix sp. CACIAM 69d]|nr:MAG: hypothetical protein BJG00_002585 [Limnothrix sp. CACIAM 69d]
MAGLTRTTWIRAVLATTCMAATAAVVMVGNSLPSNAQQSWPPGFYRRISDSNVRWVAGDGRMCRVMNRDQLTAFGGDGVVRVVGDRSTFDRGRTDTGICPWPDGIYRESNWRNIWQLLYTVGSRRYYCNITTQQQLQAYNLADEQTNPVILTVPNRSRLGFKREWAGDCVWPNVGDN